MKYVVDEEILRQLSPEDQKLIEENCQMEEEPEGSDMGEKPMSDEEKDKTKSFDEAHDKGLALIIAAGKPKKEMRNEENK